MSEDDILSLAYIKFLSNINNQNTKKHYQSIIKHFNLFLLNTRGIGLLDAKGFDVIKWRRDLELTGGILGSTDAIKCIPNSESSIENKTSILSSFYNFLKKPGLDGTPALIEINPIESILNRHKIESYGKAKKISLESFSKIIKVLQEDLSIEGLRNLALIWGYFLTGRRNSEWINLKWESINWNRDQPTYQFIGKGNKNYIDEIPHNLANYLRKYLISRWGDFFQKTLSASTYIFSPLNNQFKSLGRRFCLRLIKKIAKRAGLSEEDICVHSLRHLHAETYLDSGASVEEVRQRLKHQRLTTTQKYVQSLNKKFDISEQLIDKLGDDIIIP